MRYSIKTTKTDHDFDKALMDKKVPLLVLDQKWHHLFLDKGKPNHITVLEKELNSLLALQGRVQQEIKDLKRLKNTLMQNIVQNMDGAEGTNSRQTKKLSEDKRLIDEINDRLENYQDELSDIPKRMHEVNGSLMVETVEYCYGILRVNIVDIKEIGAWIRSVRIELKKQVIRKQDAEIKNKEIYTYMHDIFGSQMVDIFDLKYEISEEDDEMEE